MLVLMASMVLLNFAGAIPSSYYSLYVLDLKGTPFIIGIIDFVSFLALASVQFPGGYLADRYGRRWLIVTFTFGVALANLFYAFASLWPFILVGAMLLNFSLIYQPALSAIMADSIPARRRGMGFSMLMFVNNVASIFSPAVALVLYLKYGLNSGMRIAYLCIVIFYFVAALLRIKLTETLHTNSGKISLSGALRDYPKAVKEGVSIYRKLPRSMVFLFLTNALSSFIFMMSYPYLVLYATGVLHIQRSSWPIVMMCFSGSMILLALPFGKLTDIVGRKKPLLISWVFLALFPPLFLLGDFRLVIVAFLLFGASNALFGPAYQALEADFVPRDLRGKEVGCSQFFMYILMGGGGLAGGFLYQFVSPSLPFVLAFLVTIPSALITLFLVHEPKRRET
jgi:MFS family permease